MSAASRARHSLVTRRVTFALGGACLLLAGLIVPTTVTTAQAGPSIQPRNGATPTTTYAVIRVIPVGASPQDVAVDSDDDTIYVTSFDIDKVSVINGRTGLRTDDTIAVGDGPFGVAVDQNDDTVYVSNYFANNVTVINGRTRSVSTVPVGSGPAGIAVHQVDDTAYVTNQTSNNVSVMDGRALLVSSTIGVGSGPRSAAVNQGDDSVYVANFSSSSVSVINLLTQSVSTITGVAGAFDVAVDQDDDTVYVTNYTSNNVSIINGRTRSITTIRVGLTPAGIAVGQDDDTVYVTNFNSNNVSIINGRTGLRTDDTITVGSGPYDVTSDRAGPNRGLVYVVNNGSADVSVIGRVSPSLATTSGTTGDSVTIDVEVPQASYDVDDSTVLSVSFGGTTLAPTPQSSDVWQVTAPAGTPGTSVPVMVTFRGGLTAAAGTFTYNSPTPPPPPPVYPPSTPLAVSGVAGNASATVTWVAPADAGSFPVTNYEVRSTPAGKSCLVTTLTCTITGLANGTAYSFEVRALNGAGWGPWSAPSNTVTPAAPAAPSITITGSRGTGADRQIVSVTGTSTGLTDPQVRAHVKLRGQADYRPGRLVDVSAEGTFAWQRTTGKKTYVYFSGNDIQSNRVIIPAARR